MKIRLSKLSLVAAALAWVSSDAMAIICLAKQFETQQTTNYSASNCQYFSGSKQLRVNRSGAIANFSEQGDFNDQLYGHSYIYCPILGDESPNNIQTAQISVSDMNKQHDVVCQMGQSQYTKKGFAAYWGSTAKSTEYGKQVISASKNSLKGYANEMPNAFITCSLPPQDSVDDKASSLTHYAVVRNGSF